MARITPDDIEKVREATDILGVVGERVVLRQKGRVFWGPCPFHQEKTPSFKVDPSTQLWHCFGCGEGGDVFKFLMKIESLDFPDAVKVLADRAHIEVAWDEGNARSGRTQRLREVCQATADYYNQVLRASTTPGAAAARDYLGKRGFGSESAKVWNLGYAPGRGQLVAHLETLGYSAEEMVEANVAVGGDRGAVRDRFYERVMFPITDATGRTIAFGGRVLDPKGTPKYLNSNDTPIFHKSANVYGLFLAKQSIIATKTALVVEGYTDVLALHNAGFTNAVATLGTALTDKHVKLLGRFAGRVVYVFDGDEAGMRAADRAVEFIDETITPESSSSPVLLDVVVLPGGMDPADLMRAEGGAERFQELLDGAKPLLEFAIDRRLARWDLARPEEMQRALKDAASVLAPIKGSVMATAYAQKIVDALWASGVKVDLSQVIKAIQESKVAPRAVERLAEAGAPAANAGETANEPASNVTVSGSGFNSAEVRLERQALALAVSQPHLRTAVLSSVATLTFGDRLVADAFTQLATLAESEESPPAIIAKLESAVPGVGAVLSEYHFGTLDQEVANRFATDLADRLEEVNLQRQVRSLTAGLRSASDKSATAEQIVALQRRLNEIRANRH